MTKIKEIVTKKLLITLNEEILEQSIDRITIINTINMVDCQRVVDTYENLTFISAALNKDKPITHFIIVEREVEQALSKEFDNTPFIEYADNDENAEGTYTIERFEPSTGIDILILDYLLLDEFIGIICNTGHKATLIIQ